MSDSIPSHRQRIDELDEQILRLVETRIRHAIDIRRLKVEAGIPLFTPQREEELIAELVRKSGGTLPESVVRQIWESIIQGGKQIPSDQ